jgi:hypothetical protein
MMKSIAAVIAGFVIWAAIGGLLILVLRLTWPAYEAAHPARAFDFNMHVARLVIGAAATLVAGALVRQITGTSNGAVVIFGGLLFLVSLIEHLREPTWSLYPLWYHLVFIGYLLPLTWLGARRAVTR